MSKIPICNDCDYMVASKCKELDCVNFICIKKHYDIIDPFIPVYYCKDFKNSNIKTDENRKDDK